MAKKPKISDLLGITDDQMFQNVMKDPVNCRNLLHEILPKLDIDEIEVHPQERISVDGVEKVSILDIWVKDKKGRLYDIEMQVSDKKGLDSRERYYLYKLMEDYLLKGEDYPRLPPAQVIFLLPFDPKDQGYKEYDFLYLCQQNPEIKRDDGSRIIYLNSKAKTGKISPGLEDFLKLMNGEKTSNGQFITRIKDTMQIYRKTKEWGKHAMNTEELIEMTKAEAKQEEIKCMKKTLSRYRFLQVPEATIKQYLEEDYGDSFSKEEIEKIMKKVQPNKKSNLAVAFLFYFKFE